MSNPAISIRPSKDRDNEAIYTIFCEIVLEGDSYPFDSSLTKRDVLAYWRGEAAASYVAEANGRVVGAYLLKPNYPGRGSHIANAAFIVAASERNQGVGRRMAEHCLTEASRAGFVGMQFNYVVSTNASAITLWQQLGFAIVGTLPGAFRDNHDRLVDVYVMFRSLTK